MELDFDSAGFVSGEVFSEEVLKDLQKAHSLVCNAGGEGEEFLGWRDLPVSITAEQLEKLKRVAALVQKKAEILVVVGIGGSYLGAKAVISALQSAFSDYEKSHFCKVIYAGTNLSEDYMSDLLDVLQHKEYCLCVISKSGTTTEPAVAFRLLRHALEKKYGRKEAKDRIIVITDERKGALRQMCRENDYESFVIRDDVGGRFSVFTPVGLFPAAAAGVDVEALLQGAAKMRRRLTEEKSIANPAWKYAALRNILYRLGKKLELLVVYEPKLQYLSDWWQQLFGESEGKDGKGLFPVGVLNTSDLHSLGQYIQQGERLMFETVISIEKSNRHVEIPREEQDLDGLNYLLKHSMHEINLMAESGTRKAHIEGGVPQVVLTLPQLSAESLGGLMYFFEFACALSAYMLGVNPFNQPGVEAYKKNMFALLGKQ